MPNLADIAFETNNRPSLLGGLLSVNSKAERIGTALGVRTPLAEAREQHRVEHALNIGEKQLNILALSEDIQAKRQQRSWQQEDRPVEKGGKQEDLTHKVQQTEANKIRIEEARREQEEAIQARIVKDANQGFRLGLATSAQAQFGKETVLDAKTYGRIYDQPAVQQAEIFNAASSLYIAGHKEAARKMLAAGGLSDITEKNVMDHAPRLEKEANDAVYAAYTSTLGEGTPGGIGVNAAASAMTAAGMQSKEAYDWINKDLLPGFKPGEKNKWQIMHGLRAVLKGNPKTPALLRQMAALAADTGIEWKGSSLADMEVYQKDGSWLPLPKYLEVLEGSDPIEPAIQKQVQTVTAATEAKIEARENAIRFSTDEKIRLKQAEQAGKPLDPQDAATLAAFDAMERWPGLFSQPGKFKDTKALMADENSEKLMPQLPIAMKWIGERVLALTNGTAKAGAGSPAPKKSVSDYFKAK